MSVGMLLAGEGVTKDSYTQVTEKMFGTYPMREEQSPEGLVLHTAGQSDQGWYIYDIWESQERFQRFVESQLGLDRARIPATIRLTRGRDIAAACGQLAAPPKQRAGSGPKVHVPT